MLRYIMSMLFYLRCSALAESKPGARVNCKKENEGRCSGTLHTPLTASSCVSNIICACVCVHVYKYIYVYIYIYTHMRVSYICMCVHFVCTHASMHVCV